MLVIVRRTTYENKTIVLEEIPRKQCPFTTIAHGAVHATFVERHAACGFMCEIVIEATLEDVNQTFALPHSNYPRGWLLIASDQRVATSTP